MTRRVAKAEVARFLEAWFGVRQFIQAANFNRIVGLESVIRAAGGEGGSMAGTLSREVNDVARVKRSAR